MKFRCFASWKSWWSQVQLPERPWNSSFFSSIFFIVLVAVANQAHADDPAEILLEQSELALQQVPGDQEWLPFELQDIQEVLQLRSALLEFAARESNTTLSETAFFRLIDARKIFIEVSGVGKARLTLIDGIPVERVIHEKSGRAFIFIPDSIALDSKHLAKYIARNQIPSGKETKTKDVILALLNADSSTRSAEFFPKPKRGIEWLRTYKKAIWESPTLGDFTVGAFSGLAQFIIGSVAAGIKVWTSPDATFDLSPAFLSLGWGITIGTLNATYYNWQYLKDSKTNQALKSLTNSLCFAYTLKWLNSDISLSLLSLAGLHTHLSVLKNAAISNFLGRTEWNVWNKARRDMRLGGNPNRHRLIDTVIAGKKLVVEIKQSAIESQSLYLAPFFIRLMDLIDWKADMPYIGEIPAGLFLLTLTYPLATLASAALLQWEVQKEEARFGSAKPELVQTAHNAWNRFFPKIGIMAWILGKATYLTLRDYIPADNNEGQGFLAQFREHYGDCASDFLPAKALSR